MPPADQLVAPRFQNPPPSAYDPRGFAVGVLANDRITAAGLNLQQFRWRYGVDYRAHPFPPHRALNTRFMSLDGTLDGYYPGDHKGCRCSVAPVYARDGRVVSEAEVDRALEAADAFQTFPWDDPDAQLAWLRDTAEANGLGHLGDYHVTARGYSDDVRRAVREYIDVAYKWLNSDLRRSGFLDQRARWIIDGLDRGIEATTIRGNVTTFRGVSSGAADIIDAFDSGRLTGTTLRDLGYQSTSLSDKQAATFSGKNGIVLEIRLRRGQHVLIGSAEEAELVLPRGTALRIVETGTRTVRYLGKDVEMRSAVAQVVG